MKQNILIGLSMLLAVAFFSCEKEEFHAMDPVTPRAPKPMVREEIGDDFASVSTYNHKKQIVEERYDNGSKYTFTYLPNLVEMKLVDAAGTVIQTTSMKLNPKGLVSEMVQSGDPRTYYFQYDAKDRVIKQWAIFNDGTPGNEFYFFYNADGDMVKDSLYKPDDGIWNVYNNVFYTAIPNTISNDNRGRTFLGKQSKHYMQRRVMTSSIGELIVYDYLQPTLDADGRIIDRTVNITNYTNNNSSTNNYQYIYY